LSAFVLDTGALVAVDRNDRALLALLYKATEGGIRLRTNAMVIAQVWRDSRGRQAVLGRFLRGVDVHSVDPVTGRAAGELLARSLTSDAVDATVVLLAQDGDSIVTSDPDDIAVLLAAARVRVETIRC
jgi:predicted nucleic acid-binding protein